MPIAPSPIPNFNTEQPDFLANYGKMVALKNMLAQQQQLPYDLQIKQQQAAQEQEQTQQAQIQTQKSQMQLASQQAFVKALSDPELQKAFQGGGGTDSSGNAVGFDPNAVQQVFLKNKVLPETFMPFINQMVDRSAKVSEANKNDAEKTAAIVAAYKNGIGTIEDRMASILDMPVTKAGPAFDAFKQDLAKNPVPGVPQDEISALLNAPLDHLPAFLNMYKIEGNIADFHQKEAAALKTGQEADVVAQLSKPEVLASPGAQAAIQAKINDPTTDPKDISRLYALLPKAAVAQQNAQNIKAREERNSQIIAQGDPNAAGQLLASRTLTLDELKLRNATPQFIASAVQAAQKIDPNFKAPEAAAQGKIAASASNQQFFGNTDSLLVRGGTLDQLSAAGSQLPAGKIPIFNKVEQLASAATGNTPVSRYAASVLGVADDYAKVMAGSQGSDTSRQQVLDILKGAQSPQQLAAAIGQVRQQVMSQRQGRVGSNPYLKDMYPEPQNPSNPQPQTSQPSQPAVRHVPGGKAVGLTEGQTGTGSDGKKYIVKAGVWVPR